MGNTWRLETAVEMCSKRQNMEAVEQNMVLRDKMTDSRALLMFACVRVCA